MQRLQNHFVKILIVLIVSQKIVFKTLCIDCFKLLQYYSTFKIVLKVFICTQYFYILYIM